jgi:hypothetical protein
MPYVTARIRSQTLEFSPDKGILVLRPADHLSLHGASRLNRHAGDVPKAFQQAAPRAVWPRRVSCP